MDNLLERIKQDPTRPSLTSIADAGHAFSIPWSHEVRAVLSGFESTRLDQANGPWLPSSPFEVADVKLIAIIPETSGEAVSYRDGSSSYSGSSQEHLSASLGLTIGYPFLNASVSAKYDLSVLASENGTQASRNATCRMGRLVLDHTPNLSSLSLGLLGEKDGSSRFRDVYGDYYVCGYEIGADAGACLSASTKSSSREERLEITIAVKFLFFEASTTFTTSTSESCFSASLSFSGYNTLTRQSQSMALENLSAQRQTQLRQTVAAYLSKVGSLDRDVREQMAQLHLEDGKKKRLADCAAICESGLVVRLLLEPFGRLSQYVEAIGTSTRLNESIPRSHSEV